MTPWQLASLQRPYIYKDQKSMAALKALFSAIEYSCKHNSIKRSIITDNKFIKPARNIEPSIFDMTYGNEKLWPDAYTVGGVRYAYTEPAVFKEVTTYHITASEFSDWLTEQGEEPSKHIAAWFKVQGVSAKGNQEEPAPAAQVEPVQPLSTRHTQETTEQRQARRYQMCIDAGLRMPDNSYATLPRGIGALAKREGISRPYFSADVKAHIGRVNGK